MLDRKILPGLPPMPKCRPMTVILFFIVLVASLLVLIVHKKQGIEGLNSPIEGQTVPRTVFARVDFTTVDLDKTEAAKDKAGDCAPDYYMLDVAKTHALIRTFRKVSDGVRSYKANQQATESDSNSVLSVSKLRDALSAENFEYLQKILSDQSFYNEFLSRVENRVLRRGIFTNEQLVKLSFHSQPKQIYISDEREDAPEFGPFGVANLLTPERAAGEITSLLLKQSAFHPQMKAESLQTILSNEFFIPLLKSGNMIFNKRKSDRATNAAKNKVTPLMRTYYRGERLLVKGEKLTNRDLLMLEDYGKALLDDQKFESSLIMILQRSALIIVLMLFTVMYIRNVHPHIMEQRRIFLALSVITIISLVANQQAGGFFRWLSSETNILPLFIFLCLPLALPSLLLGAIFGFRAAVFAGLYVSGVAAISLDNSFTVFISGLLLNGLAGCAIRKSSDYKKFFMRSFFVISATNFMLGLIFLLPDFFVMVDLQLLRDAAVLSLVSGLFTPILALVVLFLMESFFDVSSTMSYISLTDRNHPLLKRLQQEAPGTYHHSERVASIAEKAADLIGVNPLLVQACALFHDIGKLANPTLFTENTANDDPNPHAKFTSQESARIIRSHVSYGLELAKKYKLKSPLCKAIAQHHGTDFISFFYELEKREHPENPPKEEDFRYEGPLPRERETVLISLADCAEAVARSMPHLTKELLEEKLTTIFQAKLNNGQLDQAPITAAELWLIRDSFVSSLCVMSHVRIAYPTFSDEKKDKV